MGQTVSPRLDPDHVNDRPELPLSSLVAGSHVSVVLRILVRPDGRVAEAEIVRSSGDYEVDRITANYVTNHWSYLPASVNGVPIEAWITAVVRFAST
jgi:TonB family protein